LNTKRLTAGEQGVSQQQYRQDQQYNSSGYDPAARSTIDYPPNSSHPVTLSVVLLCV